MITHDIYEVMVNDKTYSLAYLESDNFIIKTNFPYGMVNTEYITGNPEKIEYPYYIEYWDQGNRKCLEYDEYEDKWFYWDKDDNKVFVKIKVLKNSNLIYQKD